MTEDDPMTFDLSAKKKKKKKKTPFDLDAALEGGQEEKVLLAIWLFENDTLIQL